MIHSNGKIKSFEFLRGFTNNGKEKILNAIKTKIVDNVLLCVQSFQTVACVTCILFLNMTFSEIMFFKLLSNWH